MSGPVVESSRYWIVPVADDPDARRVSTLAGGVAVSGSLPVGLYSPNSTSATP
jgi:hypothetical protein